MDRSEVSTSLPMALIGKDATHHSFFGERPKDAVLAVKMEIVKVMRHAVRLFRIMVFPSSAKDLPSVLKLYGIENASETE
jgi:hypothetical protein